MKNAEISSINNDHKFKSALLALLRQIEPFSIQYFIELIQEYSKQCEQTKGRSIFLLLGPKGVGKSTTLHYLAGSKLKL